jgi:hypothetical protein
MDDYVRATYKTSGELTLLRLIGADGQMNPDLSHVDIVQDSDLNKSLKFYVSYSDGARQGIEVVNSVFLGLEFDDQLNWRNRVDQVITKLCGACYALLLCVVHQ